MEGIDGDGVAKRGHIFSTLWRGRRRMDWGFWKKWVVSGTGARISDDDDVYTRHFE
jgi:hypothetical protein